MSDFKSEFPLFKHHPELVYFDNAATAPKPYAVIQEIQNYYERCSSNIHRSVHRLAEEATRKYEESRSKVKKFLHVPENFEVVFTSGTTTAVNLVARQYVAAQLNAGDEVLISPLEHHANLVPWLMICEERGAKLKYLPLREDSTIDLENAKDAFSAKTKFLSLVHISNSLGIINPVKELVSLARARNIKTMIDGAQAVAHLPVNLSEMNADFYAFSAHKLFGPTGLGVLAAPYSLLSEMNPLIGGGDMIKTVNYDSVTFADPPARFEAGTPPIAEVWGLAAAIDWIESIGWREIHRA